MNKVMSSLLCALLPLVLLPNAVANADTPVFDVGQPFRDNGLQFKVDETYVDNDDTDCGMVSQGMWLMPILYFTNVSDETQRVNVRFQRLIDKNGRVYSPSKAAILACQSRTATLTKTVLPGEMDGIQLPFDVPAGASMTDYLLEVHQSPSSTGALVRLKCPAWIAARPEYGACP